MEYEKIMVSFHDRLNPMDTAEQTYGCRQNNPDICKYNGVPSICAFVSSDHICKHPSRSWKKQYLQLLGDYNND